MGCWKGEWVRHKEVLELVNSQHCRGWKLGV